MTSNPAAEPPQSSTAPVVITIDAALISVNAAVKQGVANLGLVNAELAQPVPAAGFRKDVNASGAISVADKGITNANLTKALPAA